MWNDVVKEVEQIRQKMRKPKKKTVSLSNFEDMYQYGYQVILILIETTQIRKRA